MTASPRDIDRRASVRRRVAMPCVVSFGRFREETAALLREFDGGGAKLKLASKTIALGGRVQLKTADGPMREAQVIWQIGQEVGLQLLAGQPDIKPLDLA